MSKEPGQSVIIDNKPGGGTIIGAENVARSSVVLQAATRGAPRGN